jgi:2-dehydro-3-deoxygalactonokinase
MPHGGVLIGVDWGTSAFRAFLLGAAGEILDRRAGPQGILAVNAGDFAKVLSAEIGGWLSAGPIPVVMSGMIGSRQGWLEAPYVTCPAGPADLAAGLVPLAAEGMDIRIVPGVETATMAMRDVMRGEETQILGALARLDLKSGRFVLPGTHSKWAIVADGQIVSFATYMTGEIYAACRSHTILGRLMQEGSESAAAFARGVREGAKSGTPGALLNRLFGVRTAGLFGELPGSDLPDYLSGLLIGAELADAGLGGVPAVRIIASAALAARYQAAAAELGFETAIVDPDCVAAGHLRLAEIAGIVAA